MQSLKDAASKYGVEYKLDHAFIASPGFSGGVYDYHDGMFTVIAATNGKVIINTVQFKTPKSAITALKKAYADFLAKKLEAVGAELAGDGLKSPIYKKKKVAWTQSSGQVFNGDGSPYKIDASAFEYVGGIQFATGGVIPQFKVGDKLVKIDELDTLPVGTIICWHNKNYNYTSYYKKQESKAWNEISKDGTHKDSFNLNKESFLGMENSPVKSNITVTIQFLPPFSLSQAAIVDAYAVTQWTQPDADPVGDIIKWQDMMKSASYTFKTTKESFDKLQDVLMGATVATVATVAANGLKQYVKSAADMDALPVGSQINVEMVSGDYEPFEKLSDSTWKNINSYGSSGYKSSMFKFTVNIKYEILKYGDGTVEKVFTKESELNDLAKGSIVNTSLPVSLTPYPTVTEFVKTSGSNSDLWKDAHGQSTATYISSYIFKNGGVITQQATIDTGMPTPTFSPTFSYSWTPEEVDSAPSTKKKPVKKKVPVPVLGGLAHKLPELIVPPKKIVEGDWSSDLTTGTGDCYTCLENKPTRISYGFTTSGRMYCRQCWPD